MCGWTGAFGDDTSSRIVLGCGVDIWLILTSAFFIGAEHDLPCSLISLRGPFVLIMRLFLQLRLQPLRLRTTIGKRSIIHYVSFSNPLSRASLYAIVSFSPFFTWMIRVCALLFLHLSTRFRATFCALPSLRCGTMTDETKRAGSRRAFKWRFKLVTITPVDLPCRRRPHSYFAQK